MMTRMTVKDSRMTFLWSSKVSMSFLTPFRLPVPGVLSVRRDLSTARSRRMSSRVGVGVQGRCSPVGGGLGEGVAAEGPPAAGVPPPGAGWADPWTGGVETAANWLWVAAKDAAVFWSDGVVTPWVGACSVAGTGGACAGGGACCCCGRCGGCKPDIISGRRAVVGA